MRVWTPEARAAQSALMKRLKPWKKSTGPKTPEGKAKAARNSFKTGAYSKTNKKIRRFFHDCRTFIKFMKTEYYKSPPRYKKCETDYYEDALKFAFGFSKTRHRRHERAQRLF